MMRKSTWLLGMVTIATALPAVAAPQKGAAKPNGMFKVERAVDTLFKNADVDKSGTLSQAELKRIEKPLAGKLRELSNDPLVEKAVFAAQVLEQDKVPPVLNGNEAVTAQEFKDFVVGELGTAFTALHPQPIANPFAANAGNNFAQPVRNNRRDNESASERRDRERDEDRERERNRQRQAQMQEAQRQIRAAQERDSFRPTPPPRERPAPSRESSRGSGGGRESGPKTGGPGGKR